FGHLLDLSDSTGVFEHAKRTTVRRRHGYCTDDVARALVVLMREPERRPRLERLPGTCPPFPQQAPPPGRRLPQPPPPPRPLPPLPRASPPPGRAPPPPPLPHRSVARHDRVGRRDRPGAVGGRRGRRIGDDARAARAGASPARGRSRLPEPVAARERVRGPR